MAAAQDDFSDIDLVARLIEGDQDALGELYDRHAARIYRVALRLLGDTGVAEEVVQETMLALWDHAEQFDPNIGTLSVWLAAIGRNRAVDRHRRQARRVAAQPLSSLGARSPDDSEAAERALEHGIVLAGAQPALDPAAAGEAEWVRMTLASAVAELPPLERQVIELAYTEELSQSEIADRLGWPIGTVKTRTRRALGALRAKLGGTLGPEEAVGKAIGEPGPDRYDRAVGPPGRSPASSSVPLFASPRSAQSAGVRPKQP